MPNDRLREKPRLSLNARTLSVLVFSLFSGWMLAFVFEGRILFALAETHALAPDGLVFTAIAAVFAGTCTAGFFIQTQRAAKRLFLCALPSFILLCLAFYFPPSFLWYVSIALCAYWAGCCVAAWGFFLRSGAPKGARVRMIADALILSNVLMTLFNMAAIHISARAALSLALSALLLAYLFALKLPSRPESGETPTAAAGTDGARAKRRLAFLCLFIAVITIDFGFMYQVVAPAYAHLTGLASWYWAVPYIAALFVLRSLPPRAGRAYGLYAGVAMIGLSYIGFMALGRSAAGYLLVNTPMLGACGIYDLFWWSVLGERLDAAQNPAKVFGIGLSANVLGVFLGVLIGRAVADSDGLGSDPALFALTVVCVTLVFLPLLQRHLYDVPDDRAGSQTPPQLEPGRMEDAFRRANLSPREIQVATLLLQGRTYGAIAGTLSISVNTVKYYIKNIYAKFGIQSRAELIERVLEDG